MRAPRPLIVRAGLSRTFGSLAGFAALGLLALGIYLLADAFAHPLDAESAGVIVATLTIAVSILLFVFIFKPWNLLEVFRRRESARIASKKTNSSAGLPVAPHREHAPSWTAPASVHETPSPIQARGIAGK